MQLTYNNQSLLATGCYEDKDPGVTRMGRQVIAEMNRVGLVVDMSHSAERSTLEAIDISRRPIAITHANGVVAPARRNKSDEVLRALTARGMLGFSIYPHHLRDGTDCSLQSFCEMIAESAARYGAENLGIGTTRQDQPDSVVEDAGRALVQRNRLWRGHGRQCWISPMPDWFEDNRHFGNIESGLRGTGLSDAEVAGIMGGNWYGSSPGILCQNSDMSYVHPTRPRRKCARRTP